MISNAVKERLLQKNWRITCTTPQELSLVLQACDDAGIKWLSGETATEWDFDGSYPLYIDFCNAIDGITGNLTGSYTGNCTDITDWFFNAIKNNNDNGKLTPQNAKQERLVQILLAIMQKIPVEVNIGGEWRTSTILFTDMGYEYRIKPTPIATPLPISREIWSHLHKIWKYATMDRDGRTFWHQEKPTQNHLGWGSVDYRSTYPLNFNSEGINWETSLTERPEDV